jgi:hypothetical protein
VTTAVVARAPSTALVARHAGYVRVRRAQRSLCGVRERTSHGAHQENIAVASMHEGARSAAPFSAAVLAASGQGRSIATLLAFILPARPLLLLQGMPRYPKDSHTREIEEEGRDLEGAPRIFESAMEDDERTQASLWTDKRASFADEDDDDVEIEDLQLDDLYAMEGPDA